MSVAEYTLQRHLPKLGENLVRPPLIVTSHHHLVTTRLCWLLFVTHRQLARHIGDKLPATATDGAKCDWASAVKADDGHDARLVNVSDALLNRLEQLLIESLVVHACGVAA